MDLEKKAKLYERALEDYLDVSVYAAYLQHVATTVKDQDRVREIYDRALQRCALHFTKNALIWATVIDFEQRVLDRMSESDEVDEEEETKQRNGNQTVRPFGTTLSDEGIGTDGIGPVTAHDHEEEEQFGTTLAAETMRLTDATAGGDDGATAIAAAPNGGSDIGAQGSIFD